VLYEKSVAYNTSSKSSSSTLRWRTSADQHQPQVLWVAASMATASLPHLSSATSVGEHDTKNESLNELSECLESDAPASTADRGVQGTDDVETTGDLPVAENNADDSEIGGSEKSTDDSSTHDFLGEVLSRASRAIDKALEASEAESTSSGRDLENDSRRTINFRVNGGPACVVPWTACHTWHVRPHAVLFMVIYIDNYRLLKPS
jgi:hypothetical protein